jgi:hypothetical protein
VRPGYGGVDRGAVHSTRISGAGLGGRILDLILAATPDAKRFRLELTTGNPAEHLYTRKGFERFPYEQMVYDRLI